MAIFDAMFEFSDNQLVTNVGLGTSTTGASTNILDFTQADLEMGAGEPVWLNVRVGTADIDTSGDNGTLVVALVYDTAAPVDGSSTVIYQTPALAEANLTAGTWILRMPLPYNVDDGRIVGLHFTTANTITAGTIDAWLDHGPQSSYDTQVTTSNI